MGDGKLERLKTSQFKVIAITNCNDVPSADKLMSADIVLCSSRLFESGPYQNKVFHTEVNAETSLNQAHMHVDEESLGGAAASSSNHQSSKQKKATKVNPFFNKTTAGSSSGSGGRGGSSSGGGKQDKSGGQSRPHQRATDKDSVYLEILSKKFDEIARRSSSSSSSSSSGAASSFLSSFGKKRARDEQDDTTTGDHALVSIKKERASSSSSSSSAASGRIGVTSSSSSSSSSSQPPLSDVPLQSHKTYSKALTRFGRETLPLECFYWRRIVLDEVHTTEPHDYILPSYYFSPL